MGALMLWAGGSRCEAQYYDEPSTLAAWSERFLHAGIEFRQFTPLSSNSSPESLTVSYNRAMICGGFRQGSVDILVGGGTYPLRGSSQATLYVQTTIAVEIPLAGKSSTRLSLPLMIAADFTKADVPGPEKNTFNVGSVGLGGGLALRHRSRTVEVIVRVSGAAQYCLDGFSLEGGWSPAVFGDAAVLLPRTLVLDGIVVGYRVRWQSWLMSNDMHDYRAFGHGPYLGVML